MTGHQTFHDLLDRLSIKVGGVVFVHSSFSRLKYLELSPQEIIEILLDRVGQGGTLVMPSYTWHLDPQYRPWKGYKNYFEQRPVFDVRHTPTNLGWIPEVFRKMPETKRSIDYWWSVCAQGPLADLITQAQQNIRHPYGPGSSFEILRQHDVRILGLGVTLNTTSLAPIVDFVLGIDHTQQVFTQQPQVGRIIDFDGEPGETASYWLLPDVVRNIKPEATFQESEQLRDETMRADYGDTIHFSYPYRVYFDEALYLGKLAIEQQTSVPWLRNYPLKSADS